MYFIERSLATALESAGVIVFDLNGLLLDDEPYQLRATNAALQPLGIAISEDQWISNCVGKRPSDYIPEMLTKAGHREISLEAILKTKDGTYLRLVAEAGSALLRPGALEILTAAREAAKLSAIATSTTRENALGVIGDRGLRLMSLVDYVVCGDDVAAGKPDPEIFANVREHLPSPGTYVVFEDSQAGVESAKAAKMVTIAVPNRFTARQDFSAADFVISALTRGAKFVA